MARRADIAFTTDPETTEERLRWLRGGCSQERFAALLGFQQSYLGKAERGALKPLPRNLISKLCEVLPGVTADWLVNGRGRMPAREQVDAVLTSSESRTEEVGLAGFFGRTIPTRARTILNLYSNTVVGAGTDFAAFLEVPTAQIALPCPPFNPKHIYAWLKVAGDSMAPLIRPGDHIVADLHERDAVQLDGQIVIANLNQEQSREEGSTVKILERIQGRLALTSLKRGYPRIDGLEPGQIVGRVCAFFRSSDPGQLLMKPKEGEAENAKVLKRVKIK